MADSMEWRKRLLVIGLMGMGIAMNGWAQVPHNGNPEPATIAPSWPVALTFDDGPNARLTPKILDILERQQVKATFFVVGQNAKAYPHLLERMIRDGDAIGNHTWDHAWLNRVSPERQEQEIQRTTDAIEEAVPGYHVSLFRAPYGMVTDAIKQRIWAKGLTLVWWSADDEDYRHFSPDRLHHFVLTQAGPGGVVLMHDIHPNTVAALEGEIVALRAKGARFLTIPELIEEGSQVRAAFPRSRPLLLEVPPMPVNQPTDKKQATEAEIPASMVGIR